MPAADDRGLVRLHWPLALRPAFDALFAIDDALADIALSASQPALAAITLAWWREALERLDGGVAPAEPRLQRAQAELLPRGLTGAALSGLEGAWVAILEEDANAATAAAYGTTLFGLAATLLGKAPPSGMGGAFGQASLARRTGSRAWLAGGERPPPTARTLRPLGALDALGWRDVKGMWPLEPEATPRRAWTLLRHRWTGRS